MESGTSPHVLIFPFPIQGHVHPMLKLAELICREGTYVTFLNTEYIQNRLVHSSPKLIEKLSNNPKFRFKTILEGVSEQPFPRVLEFLDLLKVNSRERYKEILGHVNENYDEWPGVTCVVADGILPLALQVPHELEIPVIIFRTSSASSVWAYYSIPKLLERGELPFREDADMDEQILGVEGMESFLRRRDLPGLMRNSDNDLLQYQIAFSKNLHRATAFILNSVEHLEASILPYIRSICPVTFTIGPLQLLHKTYKLRDEDIESRAQHFSSSLWKEDRSCVTWLDRQPHKSVVYVSFGSITTMSKNMFLEFWHGLVDSGHQFLWVIRPDMIQGGVDLDEFFDKSNVADKGNIVEWAPQEEVLAHPAIGCFLTHGGWNSTLESIIAGVPMICWSFFADQQVNSRFVSNVWKIGTDIKDTSERSIIENAVRRMMDGEESKTVRRTVRELTNAVKRSVEEEGSSYINFRRLIHHIKSLSSSQTN